MPEISPSKITAGTYRSMEKDYSTIGMFNFVVGRADLPDDLGYQLVKSISSAFCANEVSGATGAI